MKNPSLCSSHFYILENCKYAIYVKILKIVKIIVVSKTAFSLWDSEVNFLPLVLPCLHSFLLFINFVVGMFYCTCVNYFN